MEERHRLASMLLAQGKTNRLVAQKMGVTEKTVWNWRQLPTVRRMIREIQNEMADMGGSIALTIIPDALTTLTEIVNDPDARACDRINAARTLMNGSAAYQERKLLERQINDLERQLVTVVKPEEDALTVVDIDAEFEDEEDE
jgi:hypothetical protein